MRTAPTGCAPPLHAGTLPGSRSGFWRMVALTCSRRCPTLSSTDRPSSGGEWRQANRLTRSNQPWSDTVCRGCGRGGAARLPPIPLNEISPLRPTRSTMKPRLGDGLEDTYFLHSALIHHLYPGSQGHCAVSIQVSSSSPSPVRRPRRPRGRHTRKFRDGCRPTRVLA